jgi:predicted short-subunit dehydrogenase-like oxidoreductase (DUF2520 family)
LTRPASSRRSRPSLFLIGCGRVGCAIAGNLQRVGVRISGVLDTSRSAQAQAARRLRVAPPDEKAPATGQQGRLQSSDIVLFATPDREIARAYQPVSRVIGAATAVHCSGAVASSVFGSRRAGRLAMHPVMTFPELEARRSLRGCWFALEGDRKGIAAGRRLVAALGGRAFVLRAADKPLFHAACVFAANFCDVVVDAALAACRTAGIPGRRAFQILEPLIRQTLANIAAQGTTRALSGPAERGDWVTIGRHREVLRRRRPELLKLYQALTRRAVRMAGVKHRGRMRS